MIQTKLNEDSATESVAEPTAAIQCDYCKNTNGASLVFCRVCKRWFCNSTDVKQGSHIFLHMSYTRHYHALSHKDSILKGARFKCQCGNNNIFDLYFRLVNNEVRIRCLPVCLSKNALEDKAFDMDLWKPIIDERRISPAICIIPTPTQYCGILSAQRICQYERQRISNKSLRIEDVTPTDYSQIRSVQQEYDDSLAYYNVFEPLIRIEEYEGRQNSLVDGDKHVYVSFYREHCRNGYQPIAMFEVHTSEYSHPLAQWDQLVLTWSSNQDDFDQDLDDEYYENKPSEKTLKRNRIDDHEKLIEMMENQNQLDEEMVEANDYQNLLNRRIEYVGNIKKLTELRPEVNLFKCKLVITSKVVPKNVTPFRSGYYDIRLQDMGSSAARRINAIKLLDDEKAVSQNIYNIFLGNKSMMNRREFYVPHRERELSYDAPNIRPLNESQRDAIVYALQSEFTLIQGPPGTGKTGPLRSVSLIVATAAALVYNLVKRHKEKIRDIPRKYKHYKDDPAYQWRFKTPGPVLVCTPSNVAADEICGRIHKTGVNVVRLMAVSKEAMPSPVEKLCVHVLAKELLRQEASELLPIAEQHDVAPPARLEE